MDLPATWNDPGRDSMLFAPHLARGWNCGLNIYIRVFLNQVDPANGAANGDYPDWDTNNDGTAAHPGPRFGVNRHITRWPPGEFTSWSNRYQRECQAFWDTKFWLTTPARYNDLNVTVGADRFRPNIRCGFYLSLVLGTQFAHTTIQVVHLAAGETFFRSDSAHYDNLDLEPNATGPGMTQRAHLHEVGHLLGLGHSGEGKPGCVNNNLVCYAGPNIMGQGEDIDATDALPWQRAMEHFTGIPASDWTVSLSDIPPQRLP
jgi:hypothetical protein